MFTMLSEDDEAREYFKELSMLRGGLITTKDEYPYELDKRILRSVSGIDKKQRHFFANLKYFSAAAYVATVVLLILTIFFYTRSEEYKVQFADLTREVKKQNDKLELLMNALPRVDVSGSYYRIKQIIVRPNS
jgi:hypothetical protein